MPKWVEKILKSNLGEKSLKSTICNLSSFRMFIKKKYNPAIIIPKNPTQRKKLDMSLLIGQCLQDVHLMKRKNLIITEEKIM